MFSFRCCFVVILVFSMSFSHSFQLCSTHTHGRTHAVSMSTIHSFSIHYGYIRSSSYLVRCVWVCVCIFFYWFFTCCFSSFFFTLTSASISIIFFVVVLSINRCAFLLFVWISFTLEKNSESNRQRKRDERGRVRTRHRQKDRRWNRWFRWFWRWWWWW